MSDYIPTFKVPGVHEESLWYNEARRRALPHMLSFIRAPEQFNRMFCAISSWRADQPWSVRSDVPGPLMIWWYAFNGGCDWDDLRVGHGVQGTLDVEFVRQDVDGNLFLIFVRIHRATGAARIVTNGNNPLEWSPGFMVRVPTFISMSLDLLFYGAGNGTVDTGNVHQVNARVRAQTLNPDSMELHAVNSIMNPWLMETRTQAERDRIHNHGLCDGTGNGVSGGDGGGSVGDAVDNGSLTDDDISVASEDRATTVVAAHVVRDSGGSYEIAHAAHVVSTLQGGIYRPGGLPVGVDTDDSSVEVLRVRGSNGPDM